MILPRDNHAHRSKWGDTRPVCIQIAGTGDHGYRGPRGYLAQKLLKEHGISSILIQNPFYILLLDLFEPHILHTKALTGIRRI